MHGENKEKTVKTRKKTVKTRKKTVCWNLEKEVSFSIFKCGELNNKNITCFIWKSEGWAKNINGYIGL